MIGSSVSTGSWPSRACDAEIAGPSAVRTASTICSVSFVDARAFRDDFEDAHEVADADALVEQRAAARVGSRRP